jgi:hypothetical protein
MGKYLEDGYKAAQIPITHTHTKNCITAHIKFKHDWDITKSENSAPFFFVFIVTTTNNTEYTAAVGDNVHSSTLDTQIS